MPTPDEIARSVFPAAKRKQQYGEWEMPTFAALSQAAAPSIDHMKRYGKGLLTSIPRAVGEGYLATTDALADPKGAAQDVYNAVDNARMKYVMLPEGGDRLKGDLKEAFDHRITNPEWQADATVDLVSLLLAKKLPGLDSTKFDDALVYGKTGVQQAANGYGEDPDLTDRVQERYKENYLSLAQEGARRLDGPEQANALHNQASHNPFAAIKKILTR